jgi:WD40 repeat protein
MEGYTMAPKPNNAVVRYFEPCAATASMFLYAQGASVVCCHHDTLAIDKRFSRHSEEVQLLAVDNHSDMGAGRLVVSYDAGQTAIVWDLPTGDEVARFASYENLTCAAWMRNGNVAFGKCYGLQSAIMSAWLTLTQAIHKAM